MTDKTDADDLIIDADGHPVLVADPRTAHGFVMDRLAEPLVEGHQVVKWKADGRLHRVDAVKVDCGPCFDEQSLARAMNQNRDIFPRELPPQYHVERGPVDKRMMELLLKKVDIKPALRAMIEKIAEPYGIPLVTLEFEPKDGAPLVGPPPLLATFKAVVQADIIEKATLETMKRAIFPTYGDDEYSRVHVPADPRSLRRAMKVEVARNELITERHYWLDEGAVARRCISTVGRRVPKGFRVRTEAPIILPSDPYAEWRYYQRALGVEKP